jgi:uncharacterized protein
LHCFAISIKKGKDVKLIRKSDMVKILMPEATAVWLIDNTGLTFKQISDFCGMHELKVKGIADGDVASGIRGVSPIDNGQLTLEEIKRCEENDNNSLQISDRAKRFSDANVKSKKKGANYTPVARRQDKPDAVAWFIKHCPEVADIQIVKLIGTTKKTIESVRSRSHWNSSNIKPRDPVLLGLCSQISLDAVVNKARAKAEPK